VDVQIPQGTMVELMLFVKVIASAISLLVVSPRKAHRKTLRALRGYDDMEAMLAIDRNEGSAKADQPIQTE
jgi:hypothetical protein